MGMGSPEDGLQTPHDVLALVPCCAVRAAARRLLLDVDAVDVAGGPGQFEQLLGAVGSAGAGPREQKESLGSGTFVDGIEGRGSLGTEPESERPLSEAATWEQAGAGQTFEAASRQEGQQCWGLWASLPSS